MRNTYLLIVLFALLQKSTNAQTCTALGQKPTTAFPVCGTTSFVQNNVPICSGTVLPCPPCTSNILADRNPFWYKFTCFTAGTLGFTVTPNNLTDDYDWQLFDVTGRNPNDVYTDPSMFVCCNWSGNTGITGTSASATTINSCEGSTPIFSRMPNLLVGHDYLLMISHFTPSQSGYSLSFNGGTAVITDPDAPSMLSARADCSGTKIMVKLSKSMKCSSLANGSEFSINNSSSVVPGAVGVGCSTSFDMDSIVITLNNPLPPGNYTLNMHNGSDMNTLLDNCGNAIPPGDNQPFNITAPVPVLMDSISPVPCSASELQLVFKKPILCSSIGANGSDFVVTGAAPVVVINAIGNCGSDGMSSIVTVMLSAPISVAGNYQIKLIRGIDNNTLLNECGLETPVNSTLNFLGLSASNASFTYQLKYGCQADTVNLNYTPNNGETSWKWTFDDNTTSNQLNPTKTYTSFGPRIVKLSVSNGICNDSTTQTISLNNIPLKAGFGVTDFICPNDVATFVDSSKGNTSSWNWDFNNGFTSISPTPPVQTYLPVTKETILATRLIITDTFHCIDTAYRNIKLIPNCNIAVPTAFTPNGDGKNEYLYPLYAYKAEKLLFRVYNRYGQLIFSTQDWTVKWDGTLKGVPQDTGVYVWMLQYTNRDTGQQVFQKGTTVLIR
jgi:gliding motility-associated-like protein